MFPRRLTRCIHMCVCVCVYLRAFYMHVSRDRCGRRLAGKNWNILHNTLVNYLYKYNINE